MISHIVISMVIFLASPSRESRNFEMESRINSPDQHLIWRSSGIVNGIQRSEMLLLLPSLLCSAYSDLAIDDLLTILPILLCSAYSDLSIDDLPTIICTISSELCSAYSDLAIDDLPTTLCTISSELIRIFFAVSSHNAHLLHTFYTHAIFIAILSINDKHSLSVKYLPTIMSLNNAT